MEIGLIINRNGMSVFTDEDGRICGRNFNDKANNESFENLWKSVLKTYGIYYTKKYQLMYKKEWARFMASQL